MAWVHLAVQQPWHEEVLGENWGSLLALRGDGGALLEVSWVGRAVPVSAPPALGYKREFRVQKFTPCLRAPGARVILEFPALSKVSPIMIYSSVGSAKT